jgi:hypothetical protein
MKCVLNKEPCSYCVESAGAGADVASCLDCVAKRGSGLRGACAACSQSGGQSGRCFSCLGEFSVKTCAGERPEGPPDAPSCWTATEQTPCERAGGDLGDDLGGALGGPMVWGGGSI